METFITFFQSFNFAEAIGAITLILTGALGIAILIPGEQPDKFLKSVVDFIAKISVKK